MTDRIPTLLQQHYGLTVSDSAPLAGEVDLNYRVTTDNGQRYTLKVSRPAGDPNQAAFEAAIMRHLSEKSLPFATPVPVGETVHLPDNRLLRLQSWVEGRMLGDLNPVSAALRREWGAVAGQLATALQDFDHPSAPTDYKWNPSQTLDSRPLSRYLSAGEKIIADYFWNRFEQHVLPVLPDLPQSIIYADAHEHNLLVNDRGHLCGVIDFGDAIRTQTVNELAIACAYAGMKVPDPLGAMTDVVSGYQHPLSAPELGVLFDLVAARLLITVATAAENAQREPDNEYLQVSAAPAWALLRLLKEVSPDLARARFRRAAGLMAHPATGEFQRWSNGKSFHSVVELTGRRVTRFDLSVGSLELGNNSNFHNLPAFSRRVRRLLEDKNADFGVGGYGEVRPVYTTDDFMAEGNEGPRWRTTHLGVDVWGPAGTKVFAPLDGTIHSVGTDPTQGGYGAVIILRHAPEGGPEFFTLYGHLTVYSVQDKVPGTPVRSGDEIARFGNEAANGGWPPHLHFQVMLDTLGYAGDYAGVAFPGEAATWLDLCPSPYPFLDLHDDLLQEIERETKTVPQPADEQLLLARRQAVLGYGLSVSYSQPLHILRGSGQYLYDSTGRRYLDTVNNVAHVGHEHPEVVRAIQRQAAVLNTNSRYLHDEVLAFAEELSATLPDELSVVHFVNSGSEANEVALRMCEAWSGTRNMLAVEVGYHGNTGRTIDVSSYKFDGKGGHGSPPQTTVVPLPDVFRGRHRNPASAGEDYAAYISEAIRRAEAKGKLYGGFIAESILSCGGQIVLPDGYLKKAYAAVRARGGLCISDEVQVGVGRVGAHWWGFQLQGVVPDIVTIGKPLGNGHPLGAVVCTPAVAEAFNNGMEYFNTFGGNPVSCAAGRAVLRTVQSEGLRDKAKATGDLLKTSLRELQGQYPIIGDVRGEGLFLGFELVQRNLAPAYAPAKYLKERMRHLGFLMSTDGPDENVIKIKPPLCFTAENTEQLIDYLGRVLGEDAMKIV